MSERIATDPIVNPETEEFWQAANESRFLLRWCASCDAPHWYPRALCPFCDSTETEWRPSSGRGEIYSFSILRRGPGSPFCTAYVTLEEGISMMTSIVDSDLEALRIGQAVELAWKPSAGGQLLPMFRVPS